MSCPVDGDTLRGGTTSSISPSPEPPEANVPKCTWGLARLSGTQGSGESSPLGCRGHSLSRGWGHRARGLKPVGLALPWREGSELHVAKQMVRG